MPEEDFHLSNQTRFQAHVGRVPRPGGILSHLSWGHLRTGCSEAQRIIHRNVRISQ